MRRRELPRLPRDAKSSMRTRTFPAAQPVSRSGSRSPLRFIKGMCA